MLKWALHIMTQSTQISLQPADLVHRVKVGLPGAERIRVFPTWTQLCTPAGGFASLAGDVAPDKAQECLGVSTLTNFVPWLSEVTNAIHGMPCHSFWRCSGAKVKEEEEGGPTQPMADGQSLAECSGTTRVGGQELCHLERSWQCKTYLLPPRVALGKFTEGEQVL